VLEEQAALSGNDTHSEIRIEIEDLKLQIAQLDRQLRAAQWNLQPLQAAVFFRLTPPQSELHWT
jgi:hypothetical protein